MAGQALHPRPCGPCYVHPHLPDPCQFPQHQAVHSRLSWRGSSELSGGEEGGQAQSAAMSVEGTSSFPLSVPSGALALRPRSLLPAPRRSRGSGL